MRMEKDDLISIIIPVYNVENYLEECLKSVINQSYKRLEIILIDDGSTDKSGKICDKYKFIDKRIRVFHTKNEGVSHARNVGIENANGKYINFIDSDDYISKDMIEFLYNLIKKERADIAMCSAYDVYDSNINISAKQNIYLCLDNHDAFYYLLQPKYFGNGIWNKLISKKLFKNDRFPLKRTNGEELELLQKLIYRSKKVVYDSTPKYYYRQRNDSVTHNKILSIGLVDSMKSLCDFAGKKFPDLESLMFTNYILSCFQVYNNYIKNNIKTDTFNYIYKELQSGKNKIEYKYLNISKRLQLFLFYHYNWLWNNIVKVIKR